MFIVLQLADRRKDIFKAVRIFLEDIIRHLFPPYLRPHLVGYISGKDKTGNPLGRDPINHLTIGSIWQVEVQKRHLEISIVGNEKFFRFSQSFDPVDRNVKGFFNL